jgi:DNA polymerase III subunit chi
VNAVPEAVFYHLTETPLEAALPQVLARSLAQGWRIEVRGTAPDRMDWLDRALWLGPDEGFLPHGLQGGPHDDLQPILLTTGPGATGFQSLVSVMGGEVSPEEALARARVAVFFDGHEEEAKVLARSQWRALTGAGLYARYYAQENGRFVLKMETKG